MCRLDRFNRHINEIVEVLFSILVSAVDTAVDVKWLIHIDEELKINVENVIFSWTHFN